MHAVESIVAARGERSFHGSRRFRPPHQSAPGQQAHAGKPHRGRRIRRARAGPGTRALAALDGMLALANRSQDELAAGQADIFGGGGSSRACASPPYQPWLAADRLQREYEAIGFFLTGHPLDEYGAVLDRLRVQRWTDFAKAVKAGASMGRVAATVLDRRSGAPRPATRWAFSPFPTRAAISRPSSSRRA